MDEQRELDRPQLDVTGVISHAAWARLAAEEED
jgi:hypothetical protein